MRKPHLVCVYGRRTEREESTQHTFGHTLGRGVIDGRERGKEKRTDGDEEDELKTEKKKCHQNIRNVGRLHTVRYGALSFRRSNSNQIFYFIAFCSNQLILNRFFPSSLFSSCRFSLSIHTVFSVAATFSTTDNKLRPK